MSKELTQFHRNTQVNTAGELMVNAGRYSRGAVVCAFEMLGGVESFAEWAEENKSDFYTKMFGKLIGRETEQRGGDRVEDMLDVLDGEVEDITDEIDIVEAVDVETDTSEAVCQRKLRLLRASEQYVAAEPLS